MSKRDSDGSPPSPEGGASADAAGAVELLVCTDDVGIAQAANGACIRAYRDGIASSAEAVAPGAWRQGAVRHPKGAFDLDMGVHPTLTSGGVRR